MFRSTEARRTPPQTDFDTIRAEFAELSFDDKLAYIGKYAASVHRLSSDGGGASAVGEDKAARVIQHTIHLMLHLADDLREETWPARDSAGLRSYLAR